MTNADASRRRLTRYRMLMLIGGILFPLWGPLMSAAVPGSNQLYAGRFALAMLAATSIASTYRLASAQRYVEESFLVLALAATAFMLYLAQINGMHVAFVLAFQLLIFAAAICIETPKYMIGYLALVTIAVCLIDNDGAQVPKSVLAASTMTFGLIAIVTFYDRFKLVANLREANADHQRKAEEERVLKQALLTRETYSRALIDAIPGAVSWADRDLRYVGVNERLASMMSMKPEEFIGRHVGSIESGTEEVIRMYKDTFSSVEPVLSREVTLDLPRGKTTFFFSGSRYDEGRKAVLVSIDITAQKRHEEVIRVQHAQLVQSSKLSMLGEMSGGVAHEINNPLAVIAGYAQRMELQAKDGQTNPAEIARFSERILTMSNRIAKIVHGLKMFAREASNDPFERVTIQRILQDTVELCGERFTKHGVELRTSEGLDAIAVECRQVQISQVLLNLMINAYDAVSTLKDRWIKVEATSMNDSVELSVTDSGHGIPADVAAKMLQPFFTTKPIGHGTGLGLSISKGIVEAHGGRLYLDTTSPNTRLVVELPKRQIITKAA